jgi:TPR repeat protein
MKSLRARCCAALVGVAFVAMAVALSAEAQSATALSGIAAYNRGDLASAYSLLHAAAAAGDAEGEVNLGYMYARGQFVRADQAQAFRLYRQSADQGDGEGMNALGYKYRYGTGVAVNSELAVHWFCLGVAYGNRRAMNNLANMLDAGDYLTRDEADARSLWEQAAALGHSNAMLNLGLSYAGGTDRDLAKAQQWIVKAGLRGNPAALRMLRSQGYSGPLPPQFDETALMIPSVKGKPGHSKVCGLIS